MSKAGCHGGDVWVVVPYKGQVGSKRRLASLLNDRERQRLSQTLFEGVLDAVRRTPRVRRILVIQPPDVPIPAYAYPRLEFVRETPQSGQGDGSDGAGGLNRALRQAQRLADEGGAHSLLMLPSDLPMVSSADIDAVVQAATEFDIVISPDRASEGTNALLLRPPAALEPAFGAGSFARHQELAVGAGLRVMALHRWGLALDLDTPADVLRLYALAPECPTARLLRDMAVTEELLAGLSRADTVSSGA